MPESLLLPANFALQSNLPHQSSPPVLAARPKLHVAIIMDGNGRWAARRGLPRTAGHHEGIRAARRVVEAAPDLGVTMLTLFAFSSDNWRRPPAEVRALMALLRRYLRDEVSRLAGNGVRLTVIGRRDRLPDGLACDIEHAERATAHGTRLSLTIALDYSARAAITNAAAGWFGDDSPSLFSFGRLLARQGAGTGADVDLLIRSGGEKRLSDFLLWEMAYAELCFVDTFWPDFDRQHLAAAIADFHARERRFGGLGAHTPALAAE
jgi:undecaprenyl diphosphate synthase